eukprot:12657392-Alexandrium_andersonii.AAC.1
MSELAPCLRRCPPSCEARVPSGATVESQRGSRCRGQAARHSQLLERRGRFGAAGGAATVDAGACRGSDAARGRPGLVGESPPSALRDSPAQ